MSFTAGLLVAGATAERKHGALSVESIRLKDKNCLAIKSAQADSGREMAESLKDLLKDWRGILRQKEAAEKLGVPYATYRKWETGKRTPGKLTEIEVRRRLMNESVTNR